MAKFAKASSQAASVIHALKTLSASQRAQHAKMTLPSLGTARDFETCLTHIGEWMKSTGQGTLRDLTPEKAVDYLQMRAAEVGQKTLDQERQAAQKMLQDVTHQLRPGERLPVVKSEQAQVLSARAYSAEQMAAVAAAQPARYAISTEIAYASGLRAHELLTLRPLAERAPDDRPASAFKFSGRPDGQLYTVQGKGGLVRVVSLPNELAERLESLRLAAPRTICDREIYYKQFYDIGGGKLWSNNFSKASMRVLDFSTGAHGLRHSYAQDRMEELRVSGRNRMESLRIVSQELGHFRPEITETYLR